MKLCDIYIYIYIYIYMSRIGGGRGFKGLGEVEKVYNYDE